MIEYIYQILYDGFLLLHQALVGGDGEITDDIKEKVNLLRQAAATFEQAKEWHYNKSIESR